MNQRKMIAMRMGTNNGAERPGEVLECKLLQLRREKEWHRLIRSLTATALTVFLLFGVILGIGMIRGQSMVPSFQNGDIVLFWRLSKDYVRDDVIFFRRDAWQHELIKRVAAVPGDTVDVDTEGRLTVNGIILDGTFAKPGIGYPLKLRTNEYFVLGDNRSEAMDSRDFGSLEKKEIDGKVILVVRTKIHGCFLPGTTLRGI